MPEQTSFLMRISWWLMVAALACVGCSSDLVTVSGTVSVGGQPLPKGEIVFYPVPEGGTPVAGQIVAGKYVTAPMVAGDKKVVISESIEQEVITSSEELQRRAAEGRPPAIGPQSLIRPETKGNSRQVTVGKETKTLDFELQMK